MRATLRAAGQAMTVVPVRLLFFFAVGLLVDIFLRASLWHQCYLTTEPLKLRDEVSTIRVSGWVSCSSSVIPHPHINFWPTRWRAWYRPRVSL